MYKLDIASCINTLGVYSLGPTIRGNNLPEDGISLCLPQNGFRGILADAAYNNMLVLNLLMVNNATDNEVPTLFMMFDITIKMLECLTLTEFIDRFGPSMVMEHKQSAIASKFIKDHSLDRPLDKSVLIVLRNFKGSLAVFNFFESLMRIASNMARISGQPNVYNDYRMKNNIQAELACQDCYYVGEKNPDCLNCNHGYLYNYATGETFEMQKTYNEYKQDINLYRDNWLTPEKRFNLPF